MSANSNIYIEYALTIIGIIATAVIIYWIFSFNGNDSNGGGGSSNGPDLGSATRSTFESTSNFFNSTNNVASPPSGDLSSASSVVSNHAASLIGNRLEMYYIDNYENTIKLVFARSSDLCICYVKPFGANAYMTLDKFWLQAHQAERPFYIATTLAERIANPFAMHPENVVKVADNIEKVVDLMHTVL
jgi:hypothetical protein